MSFVAMSGWTLCTDLRPNMAFFLHNSGATGNNLVRPMWVRVAMMPRAPHRDRSAFGQFDQTATPTERHFDQCSLLPVQLQGVMDT